MFLDEVGAINAGAQRKQRANRKSVRAEKEGDTEEVHDFTFSASSIFDHSSKRSRRVKDEFGNWYLKTILMARVCEKDLHATVIDHEKMESQTLAEKAKLAALLSNPASKRRKPNPSSVRTTDPFKLIEPCINAGPPFRVTVMRSVLALIDFHAHLAHTEVIGLLGGLWNPLSNLLEITLAYACKSASTEMQCEMDPSSEMQARAEFSERGLVVVGWYHSHPTFVTWPSIRDVENQAAYQELFQQENGVEPFIGGIVNPYPMSGEREKSGWDWIGVGHEWNGQEHSMWISRITPPRGSFQV